MIKSLVLTLAIIILLTNCSFIASRVGNSLDKSNNKVHNSYDKNFLVIEQGSEIQVELEDKRIINGYFDRFINKYNSKYIKEYRSFYLSNKHIVHLPILEDTIEAKYLDGTIKSFLFFGFNLDGIYLKSINANTFKVLNYSQISQITYKKEPLNLEVIKRNTHKRIVPVVSALLINSKYRNIKIPLNEIKSIQTFNSNLEAFGIAMGALVDIFLVVSFFTYGYGGH